MTDYYNTLGIDYNATADDIKRAYRKLSFENHTYLNAFMEQHTFEKKYEPK